MHVTGCTILGGAAFMRDSLAALEFLVSRRADPLNQNQYGMLKGVLPLHVAADQGRSENIRYLLKLHPETWYHANMFGVTPGHIAVLWNNILPEHQSRIVAEKDTAALGPAVTGWCGHNFVGLAVAGTGGINVLDAVIKQGPT